MHREARLHRLPPDRRTLARRPWLDADRSVIGTPLAGSSIDAIRVKEGAAVGAILHAYRVDLIFERPPTFFRNLLYNNFQSGNLQQDLLIRRGSREKVQEPND